VYQPAPRVDLYASFANSFSPLLDAQPDGTTLEPISGRQFEFGQRFHMAGGRVDLNTAVYHQVRKNYAFSRPGGLFDQASDITSKGFEADVETTPVSNWRINGGYAFTHAELGDYLVSASTNLAGLTPVFAPRHTFNLWTAYDWPSGLGLSVGVRALSSQFGDRGNVFTIDGYGLLNMAVRYRRGQIEYALNVNNLTDTEYIASTLYDTQVYPGEPINVLGTIRVRLR
jgi:iron complex outermembrane receptor protein